MGVMILEGTGKGGVGQDKTRRDDTGKCGVGRPGRTGWDGTNRDCMCDGAGWGSMERDEWD